MTKPLHGNTCRGPALGRFRYLPRFDAVRADGDALRARADFCPYALKVRLPAAASPVVGMTDIVAADRLLSANRTYFCHRAS